MEADRLEQLKLVLGVWGEEQDGLLGFALEAVRDQVLAYLGCDALPAELERPLVLMAASYWRGAALGTTEAAPGPVASVSRGNVSTSFAVSTGGGLRRGPSVSLLETGSSGGEASWTGIGG